MSRWRHAWEHAYHAEREPGRWRFSEHVTRLLVSALTSVCMTLFMYFAFFYRP